MLVFLNCVALCIYTLGTYFVWWDRKNVTNQFLIGFCIIGYIIPTLILDFDLLADSSVVKLYAYINILGSVFFIAGLFFGFKWERVIIVDSVLKLSQVKIGIKDNELSYRMLNAAVKIYSISLVVMALCFVAMGFVPMFASDPYLAKQFKGMYQPSYQHVALFYRTAKQFIELLMPFIIIDFYVNKKIKSFILILIGIILVFITMSRSETVTGLLTTISIIISMRRGKTFFAFYIIFLVVFFSFGSSFWSVLAYFFPNSGFANIVSTDTVAETIAAGAPDIPDQLQLLGAFVNNHASFTYGLTFIGGLIPFNFKWNPAVWTLMVSNQTDDISGLSSGGLRLPVSLWGYFSFGWIGVCVIPFISAFFTGYIVKKIRRIIELLKPDFKGLTIFYFLVFMYLNLTTIFTEFYKISIYSFPAFIFFGLVMYKPYKVEGQKEISN